MNEKQMAQWEKTRKKGFDWYVVKTTLLFGIGTTVCRLIFDRYSDGIWNVGDLPINIISYLIGGFFLGWISYEWNEYSYKKKVEGSGKKF